MCMGRGPLMLSKVFVLVIYKSIFTAYTAGKGKEITIPEKLHIGVLNVLQDWGLLSFAGYIMIKHFSPLCI